MPQKLNVAAPGRPRLSVFGLVVATKNWATAANRSYRNSKQAGDGQKPAVTMENTYHVEPDEERKFNAGKVEKLLSEVMESRLSDVQYDASTCKELVKDLSDDIKASVKNMDFPRYKIVCNLVIMENNGQGTEVASRCIWDSNQDSFAAYMVKNKSLIAIAHVHGLYFE